MTTIITEKKVKGGKDVTYTLGDLTVTVSQKKYTKKEIAKRRKQFFQEQAEFIRFIKSMKGPRPPCYVHCERIFIQGL